MRQASIRVRALAALSILTAVFVVIPTNAGADPAQGGSASAHAVELSPIIPKTPLAESTLADEDATETLIDIPADPVAVSGTATATAAVHKDADLDSQLLVNAQGTEGPYNAAAFGEIEGAEVLVDAVAADVSLVQVDAVRAEAVAVCTGDTVTYSANSEIVNLDLGGEDVPLNGPLEEILDGVKTLLEETTLEQVISVERNVVTESADGIAVDALRLEILQVANPAPIFIVLGHAELSGVTCGPDAALPECSDEVDNADPEDELADEADPGCHTDGDANNPASYDPADDDERDESLPRVDTPVDLPRTGGDIPLAAAMLVGLSGVGALHLMRRRSIV